MKERRRHQSYSSTRRSFAAPFAFATAMALVAAAGVLFVLASLGANLAAPVALLSVVAPLTAAMIAASASASVLHWRKVTSRGPLHAGVAGLALAVLLVAQLLDIARVVALLAAGGPEALLSLAAWRDAFVLPGSGMVELGRIPGLAAAAELFGPDGAWVSLAIEIALVVGLARWMTGRALAAPLCIACRAWCVRQRGVVERAGDAAAPELVRQRVAARDWRFFRDLGPARGGASLRFDLSRCPRCNRNSAVSVMWERPLWRDRWLIEDVRLGADDVRTLLSLAA